MHADQQRQGGGGEQPRGLVVEDDRPLREVLTAILSTAGFRTGSAATVAEGMRLLLNDRPGHLVLDLRLTDGSGVDILRHIRTQGLPVKVAVLTGVGDMEVLSQVVQLGADKVFIKPFGVADVRAWLRAAAEQDESLARIRRAILA